MKNVYVSSFQVMDKCVYAYSMYYEGNKELKECKVGEFHLSRPNKACMYVSDMVKQHHKEYDDLVFCFDTRYALDYVSQMRDIKSKVRTHLDKEKFDFNNVLMDDFMREYNPHLLPLLEIYKGEIR